MNFNFSELVQLLFSGVALGMIYALLAFGYNITFSTSRTLNFSQGDFLMLGAFVSYTIIIQLAGKRLPPQWWHWAVAILAAAALGGLLAVILQQVAIKPALKTGSDVSWILATISLGIIAKNVAERIWGTDDYPVKSPLGSELWEVGPTASDLVYLGAGLVLVVFWQFYGRKQKPNLNSAWVYLITTVVLIGKIWLGRARRGTDEPLDLVFKLNIDPRELLIILAAAIIMVGFEFFRRKSLLGKAVTAVAADKDAAALMGINVPVVIAFSFIVSCAIAAMGGVLVGPLTFVSASMGALLGVKAYAVSVIGGLQSGLGVIAGGLILGLSEQLTARFVSTGYKDTPGFVILILILLLKPDGLFGKAAVKKV